MSTEPSSLRSKDAEIVALRARLEEAEETLRAIRGGEVDAILVEGTEGPSIFSLESADAASNRLRGDILSQVSDAVVAVDLEQRITFFNTSAERLYGVSRSHSLGRKLIEIHTVRWFEPNDEVAAETALNSRGEWRGENIHVTANGTPLNVESAVSVLRASGGAETGLIYVVRDIAERKVAESALRVALEELASASRAKDGFLAALSHELRTPLTPVLLAAADLRDDPLIPPDARAQLAMIERNVSLEARLIDDLLDLTTIAQGKLQIRSELCDTHSLIGLVIEMVRAEATAKAITVECALNARHSGIAADPARFQQVIWNLLRNAVKFTPRGGRVAIETAEVETPEGKRWLRITVTDSGLGIPAAEIDKIFRPFDQGGLTGDHRYGGLGLGLAIARAVVELHGGRIQAVSAGLNRGATFVVELPGAVSPQLGISGAPLSIAPDSTLLPTLPNTAEPIRSLRILLVEDHDSTLQTLARLLRRDGHTIVTATSIADALAGAATSKLDLVVSDLGLPDGTGLELMEKLRSIYGLRGVALSGYGMEEDLIRSRAAGFVAHLVKPVRIADLRSALTLLTGDSNGVERHRVDKG